MKNKILFIAYYFPPDNGVGGLRIAKFARYLPSFDWEPVVLTVEDRYREQLDLDRIKDLGGIRVVKTRKNPRLNDLLLFLRDSIKTIFRKANNARIKDKINASIYGDGFTKNTNEGFLQKLKRYYISISSIPDGKRCWVIPAATRTVMELITKRYDCILSSSPPHSSHLIGLVAKKLIKVKWIADFRDPWVDFIINKTPLIRSELSDKIEIWLEKLVVHNADKIITTTDEHRKTVMKRFPKEPEDKFVYIPNGIDTEKFLSSPQPERFGQFTISYTGTIGYDRTPEPLFMAINKLVSSGRIDPSEIKIRFIGNLEAELINGKTINCLAKKFGLNSIVEVSGPIPFSEALHFMQRSHLLLLLAAPIQKINMPAKIYDYFGSGTKILGISRPGAAAELIRTTNCGACFDPSDIEGIADYVFSFMKRQDRDHIRNDPMLFSNFDIKHLTGTLSQIL
jgi:glycosyltransferase involved in cell wall biosynthesis